MQRGRKGIAGVRSALAGEGKQTWGEENRGGREYLYDSIGSLVGYLGCEIYYDGHDRLPAAIF